MKTYHTKVFSESKSSGKLKALESTDLIITTESPDSLREFLRQEYQLNFSDIKPPLLFVSREVNQ